VLVSRTVADLITGSDIELRNEGEHELKGVTGSWRLFSVRN
jgi:class 3 adenylate cyclase